MSSHNEHDIASRSAAEPARIATERSERPAWHIGNSSDVLARLASDVGGLSQVEAERRLLITGPNELRAAVRLTPWRILLSQLQNVLVVILLVAIGLSAVLGHTLEAVAIGAIVLFAVLLGFLQEFRAERAMQALRRLAAPQAWALRDGEPRQVPARELVPGDVVMLSAGNRLPADARLLDAANLQVEEAVLTGESLAVEKSVAPIADPHAPLGDRLNLVFAGTTVTYGRGRAVVVATGMQTEFGQIATLLQEVESGRTPLQENLDRVGRALAQAALAVVVLIVALGVWRGEPLLEMLIFGIALAVAVVPEALPAVVTISLALGVQRLVRRHALMRRLPAVETLGSTSIICSDKTGTLTKDEMTVRKIVVADEEFAVSGAGYDPQGVFSLAGQTVTPDEPLRQLLRAAVLASDARLMRTAGEARLRVQGDPTEGALVVAAAKAGLDRDALWAEFPRKAEIPFTAETKRMTTLHSGPAGPLACSKGAPEVILDACTQRLTRRGVQPLDPAARRQVLDDARRLAGEALRVLAIAERPGAERGTAETDLTFLGLVGMIDPPRPEAREAIAVCRHAGIKPVMITGDHPSTAQAVARELGVLREGRVVSGSELEQLSDDQLAQEVETIDVYARVSPAHKLRVVEALQRRGHVVAMTGDGVNDAPALKKADIGIAMGITGTDVTREAAAMTLTDDNFASIVAAVEEGRAIYGNIKKYLMYLLSSNIGEIGLMVGASLADLPLPLTAVQLLYVNLATDGLPALALAVDPQESDLMNRPPRSPRSGIFTRPVVLLMSVGGLWSASINLALFAWALHSGRSTDEAMTMTFASLVLIQFFKAYNFRSDRRSLLHRPWANRWLNISLTWELLILLVVVYLPLLQQPFQTYSLTIVDWLLVGGVALTISPVLELAKVCVRRGWFGTLDP